MANGYDVKNVSRDKKKFTATASKAHLKNFVKVHRGGYRL